MFESVNFCFMYAIYLFIFFLIIMLLPRSTLFPYTTLFRSKGHRVFVNDKELPEERALVRLIEEPELPVVKVEPKRSEEHTSELQSLRHLVCRLLLEKKKNHFYRSTHKFEKIVHHRFIRQHV